MLDLVLRRVFDEIRVRRKPQFYLTRQSKDVIRNPTPLPRLK